MYNHFNPKGLNLIRSEKIITWENDSLINVTPLVTKDKIEVDSIPVSKSINLPSKQLEVKPFTEPKAIKIDLAYKLFNQGIKFIDARPEEEFKENHIKGAINIPFYGSEKYDSVLNKISKDEIVVTYCNGDDCDLSILLGDEIFNKGYKKVYVFFGGWNDWLKKGYPVAK